MNMPFNHNIELNTYRLNIMLKSTNINNYILSIINKNNNEEIGNFNIVSLNNEFDIKFNIIDSYKGQGFATEALRELLRYLFMEFKANMVIFNGPFNKLSSRVLIKNNLLFDGNKYYISLNDYYKKKEKVQLFDDLGNPLNDIFFRGERFIDGKNVGVVDVIIYNTKYDKYLMTKRDLNKETYPGFWEITGGAIDYGENKDSAAIRESLEETGISLNSIEYKYNTLIEHMIYFTYIGYADCELDNVKLQAKETIDYKWLSKDDFKKMYEGYNVPDKQKLRLKKLIEKL